MERRFMGNILNIPEASATILTFLNWNSSLKWCCLS